MTAEETSLKTALKARAKLEGFEVCRIASASLGADAGEGLQAYLAAGHHGQMSWMERRTYERSAPNHLWPEAQSVILLGMNYGPESDPLEGLKASDKGLISVYAQRRDYHDVIKKKLKALARWLAEESGAEVKVFVDTAPVMEKPLAQKAGLGWQGKHTNLVSREMGSWLFLGSVFTTLALPVDEAEVDHCGSCSACLDVCPTKAFPAPYQLDARRCISYLTIEHKGMIDEDLRAPMGNHIYGCDDCLAVCPWNKYAQTAQEAKLALKADMDLPDLIFLSQLDDARFREFFKSTPIKRTGLTSFLRNVLIAMGNMQAPTSAHREAVVARLGDKDGVVRATAIWALAQIDKEKLQALAPQYRLEETDPDALAEWQKAIGDAHG
jgi:epoxyqueuosine reductase